MRILMSSETAALLRLLTRADRHAAVAARVCLAALCVLAAAGCRGGEEGEPDPGQAEVTEAAASGSAEESGSGQVAEGDGAEEALHRFLPDEMRRSARPESFAHEAHVQIDCAVCHDVAQGHGSHGEVACADCHRSSALSTVRALSPADCQACHHGADQVVECAACHESRPALVSTQELHLEVWSAARERELAFDHAWHEAIDCARCHQAAPELVPAESCASCHEDHHVATFRCASCHTTPRDGAHDVESHLTCSGSGCHRAPLVEAIADERAVCLVCHQAQEEHELGGDCIECHRVRPGVGGRGGA